jgi:hypothetical protein
LITSFRSHAAAQTPSVIFSSCARVQPGKSRDDLASLQHAVLPTPGCRYHVHHSP